MTKLLTFMTLMVSFVAFGVAQKSTYHPAPAPSYHPPASRPAPSYHAPASRPAPSYHPPASRQSTPRQNAQPRQNTQPRQAHEPHQKNAATHNNATHNDREAKHNQQNADRNKRNADRNAAKAHTNSIRSANKERHARNNVRHRDYRAARGAYRNGRFNDRYYASHFGASHAVMFGTPGLWVGTPFASPFWWGGFQWGFGPGIFWPEAWGMGDGCFIEYLDGGYVLANPAFPDTTLPLVADADAQPVDEADQQ